MSRKTELICYFEAETDKSIFLRVECWDRIKVSKDENSTGWMSVKKTYPIVYDKTEPVLFKRFRCVVRSSHMCGIMDDRQRLFAEEFKGDEYNEKDV